MPPSVRRIQPVEATPDYGGAGCGFEIGRNRCGRIGARSRRRDDRRWLGARIGCSSGQRSRRERRPGRLASRRACLSQLRIDGSCTLAGWILNWPRHCLGGICHQVIVRRSHCGGRKAAGCERSLAGWAETPRRSLGSCTGTRRRGRFGWTTGLRRRSGMRSVEHVAQESEADHQRAPP